MVYPQVKRDPEDEHELLEVEAELLPAVANVEMRRLVYLLLHTGHSFVLLWSEKPTINSNFEPHSWQTYSYKGIEKHSK